MPRKKKHETQNDAQRAAEPKIPKELLDQLVTGPITQGEFESIFRSLKKAIIERAMGAEMSEHLGYKRGEPKPAGQSNQRNGSSGKTVLTDDGPVDIEVPRDRDGNFEPLIIPKHERRFTGFDQKIIAMYARGMTVREIQGYLLEIYGTQVSPDFISKVTDEVMAEVTAWQSRPLEPMYPVVFFDALRVKIRDDAVVRNKAVYLALGVLPEGTREVLGIWIEQTEGAKFWLKVFNELRSRGVHDILIAVVDGLKGLAEAIETAFPKTTVQICIVHLIRNSLDYASWKERKTIAAALRPIYTAATAEAAREALDDFAAAAWGAKYPTIVQSWRRAWEQVIPFFAFPPEVRRVIYTTNVIESLNMQLRKIIKTRGHFPNDDAAIKLIWLALRNINDGKIRSAREWKLAMNQFAVLYGDRFVRPAN
ncbi:IS256 family transposase [Povalibacter sp.]|uniref:IS256 family transposase n=1 Tax=Povalibacter sp. TaxID=1962978 RepID=UPI002F40FD9E